MNNKLCIITGGAAGIGRYMVEKFISEHYIVSVIDADENAGKSLTKQYGDKALFYHGDITEQSVLDGFLTFITNRFQQVDAFINNACIGKGGLHSCGYDDFNYILRMGVTAPFYLTKLLMPHFVPGASIVNISSTRASMSQPDTESYTAAKGGISALTHAMSVTLAGKVRVNTISPGWIDTTNESFSQEDIKQHPAGRIGVPHDIAEMAFYLCSDKAGFITGQDFVIDGGMTRQMIYHNDHGWSYRHESSGDKAGVSHIQT